MCPLYVFCLSFDILSYNNDIIVYIIKNQILIQGTPQVGAPGAPGVPGARDRVVRTVRREHAAPAPTAPLRAPTARDHFAQVDPTDPTDPTDPDHLPHPVRVTRAASAARVTTYMLKQPEVQLVLSPNLYLLLLLASAQTTCFMIYLIL